MEGHEGSGGGATGPAGGRGRGGALDKGNGDGGTFCETSNTGGQDVFFLRTVFLHVSLEIVQNRVCESPLK